MRTIELLSPARDADCGIEAIRHGADAVYIGGPDFGARAAAGNSVDDIRRLCDYAHLFGAKVYVTLNTILYDRELAAAERLIVQLYRAGVDALIVQDWALLRLNLPPIALHASTQMDNCTPEKARLLEAAGFRQIVLARELSLAQIKEIAQAVSVPLEAFVHGALCVSYSGRCYASQYCFGRSANRGRCAQFCRLGFDLVDADGIVLARDKHLLSLRDMNRSDSIEEMIDAGVSSFKIEGRLKDASYVKNVTAWYRRRIDEAIARRPDTLRRSSYGTSVLAFSPDPAKSFNRGFTDYFLHGRTPQPIHNFLTPKAMGPAVCTVERVAPKSIVVKMLPACADGGINAGDGLCFIDEEGRLQGFRVNKAEGGTLFPAGDFPRPGRGATLYRNQDFAFEKILLRPDTADRRLRLDITLRETPRGYVLDLRDEAGVAVSQEFEADHASAQTPQQAAQERTLSKLGNTPFAVGDICLKLNGERFIPASLLTEWRRTAVDALLAAHRASYSRDRAAALNPSALRTLMPESIDFKGNVANAEARAFLQEHGATDVAPAFELLQPAAAVPLMTCRHCLRFAFGQCPKQADKAATPRWKEPVSLRLPDGRTFPLRFDCQRCEMQVLKP